MRPALVIGPAATLEADLVTLRLWRKAKRPVVIAVNDAGWLYRGRIDHWATLHWEKMGEWQAKRAEIQGAIDLYETWTRKSDRSLKWQPPIPSHYLDHWDLGPGSSGFYGVQVAIELGHTKVIVAGIPMTATPYSDGAGTWAHEGGSWPQHQVDMHREGWERHVHRLTGVRSMSGWTRELLGRPDVHFLDI